MISSGNTDVLLVLHLRKLMVKTKWHYPSVPGFRQQNKRGKANLEKIAFSSNCDKVVFGSAKHDESSPISSKIQIYDLLHD